MFNTTLFLRAQATYKVIKFCQPITDKSIVTWQNILLSVYINYINGFFNSGIFMAQVINEMDVPSHSFVFHGTGERYFLICVVNVLLTIITLGIYLPWALMKCKRYLYANMEVNGQRFSYGITGGNVFVSCLVFVFAISQS